MKGMELEIDSRQSQLKVVATTTSILIYFISIWI